ncbi:hypothetical protein LTR37_015768 [Vermiconidia calcicola]|uniref:Uncharacterized protein n=1 Tax=Vermiconidia calcicola TaxID=1690605 RepID=A0ACC3MPU7_9PEZI|nr:hypothetical protein LTR37_015768 [Vermiconidia calcicola]
MPPPHDGNEYLPFVDLIRLHKIHDLTYKSIALPFSPGGQLEVAIPRAYGGHVYAQSAWAACQTVGEGFLIFVCSRTKPFVYKVDKIRDGRSYATRFVSVTVEGEYGICFTCTVSFKKAEKGILDFQEKVDLWQQYKPALEGKRPEDFEEVPGMDVPWYWKLRKDTGQNDEFPGLQCTKVDMTPYNRDKHPLDRRELMFYRPIGRLPPDPNMHLCAHLYASDRNSLYIVTNLIGVGDLYSSMSSLVHTTVFHSSMQDLMFGPSTSERRSPMIDTSEEGRWFCKEDFTTRTALGRAMYHGRVWSADGSHVATLMQDGMVRYQKKPEPSREEVNAIRDRQASWKLRDKPKPNL